MKYRPDPDLDFLQQCTDQDLEILANVLLHDKNGQLRSIRLANNPVYGQSASRHADYWDLIAGEIQGYGSSPLATLARAGRGKLYAKILDAVCACFDVRHMPDVSVEVIERELCLTLFNRALPHIPAEDLQILCQALHLAPATLTTYGITQSLLEAMRLDDQMTCLMHMLIAHGAALFASNRGYADLAPEAVRPALPLFEAPLAAELTPACTLSKIAAAYWIIPSIFQIAYLRAVKNAEA